MTFRPALVWLVVGVGAVLGGDRAASVLNGTTAAAQPQSSHVTIPFLANATRPADLDFEGGECDVDGSGDEMRCTFQQVLLTTSDLAPDTCLVTTNQYERVFKKQTAGRWVSNDGPQQGPCGVVDVTTLQDGGGVRWTMETRKVVTNKDASPACRVLDEPAEILSWNNIRRPLPCRFVQPGSLDSRRRH